MVLITPFFCACFPLSFLPPFHPSFYLIRLLEVNILVYGRFAHNQALLSGAGNKLRSGKEQTFPTPTGLCLSLLRVPSPQPKQLKRPETGFLIVCQLHFFISFSCMHTYLCMPHHAYGDQGTILFLQHGGSQGWISGLQPGQLVPSWDEPSCCDLLLPCFQNLSAILWAALACIVFLCPSLLDCVQGLQVYKCISNSHTPFYS